MPPPPLYQVHNGRPCPQKTKRRKHQRNGPAFILYNQHLAFLGFSSFSQIGANQQFDVCSEIDSQGAPIQHFWANMIITYQRPQLKSWTDLLHRHLQIHPKSLSLCSPKVVIVDEKTPKNCKLGVIPSFSESLDL